MAVRSGAQLVTSPRVTYSRPAFAESIRHVLCPRGPLDPLDPLDPRRVTEAELAAVEDCLGNRNAVLD